MERGILDKTHLHFFTRDTAKHLLKAADLRIQRISPTGIPIDELWRTGEGNPVYDLLVRIQHVLIGLQPRLFANQFIIEADQMD
jgi:hypothetical protein